MIYCEVEIKELPNLLGEKGLINQATTELNKESKLNSLIQGEELYFA